MLYVKVYIFAILTSAFQLGLLYCCFQSLYLMCSIGVGRSECDSEICVKKEMLQFSYSRAMEFKGD